MGWLWDGWHVFKLNKLYGNFVIGLRMSVEDEWKLGNPLHHFVNDSRKIYGNIQAYNGFIEPKLSCFRKHMLVNRVGSAFVTKLRSSFCDMSERSLIASLSPHCTMASELNVLCEGKPSDQSKLLFGAGSNSSLTSDWHFR